VGIGTALSTAEAAGHARDLAQALAKVSEIEQRRAVLIHQAVHDLRSNVQSVSAAAARPMEGSISWRLADLVSRRN